MMVVNHGLSGYICGRVAMPALRRLSPLTPRTMSAAFFLGSMMPDGDIVTRLLLGQNAYFSPAWYGHRQLSHSILGTFLLAGLLALAGFYPWLWRSGVRGRELAWLWGCLWFGGGLHILGDLMTPGMSLRVFWPFTARFGSWSHIGWFTPYFWWMFLTAVVIGAALRWAGARLVAVGWVHVGIYVAGAAWFVYAAAAYRWIEYMVTTRYESAAQYTALQHSLLPEPLVNISVDWVRTLWLWLVY